MSDRGFIDWKPRGESLVRLDMAQAIIAEYEKFLPLTLRQVFYRAVGMFEYDKSEKAYKRLGYTLAKARRAGLISMGAIRDDGVSVRRPRAFAGLNGFRDHLVDFGNSYARDRQAGQPFHIILLCEAAGMVPQLARVAHPYGVEVRSSGGYDSVTAKHDLAVDIIDLDRDCILLHLGDLDPSGEDMFSVISEDVTAFVKQMRTVENPYFGTGGFTISNATVEARRIAVTREQADEMELPTAPPKKTDSRAKNFRGETVQCEAIPPDALNRIVEDAIQIWLNKGEFEENLRIEAEERALVQRTLSNLSFSEATA